MNRREFYGPYEVAWQRNLSGRDDSYVYVHPEDDEKLIREMSGYYIDIADMEHHVARTERFLAELEVQGIRHVRPTYYDETAHDEVAVVAFEATRLANAESVEPKLQRHDLTDKEVALTDDALSRALLYMNHTEQHGGLVDPEILRIDQFCFYDDQNGERHIAIVDVEPMSTDEEPSHYRPDGDISRTIKTIVRLSRAAILLRQSRPNQALRSIEVAKDIAWTLDGDREFMLKVAGPLIESLEVGEVAPELQQRCDEIFYGEDEDD